MKKQKFLPLLLLMFLAFTACEQRGAPVTDGDQRTFDDGTRATTELPSSVQNELQSILNQYYDLKEALVEAEPDEAQSVANDMLEAIDETGHAGVEGLQNRLNNLRGHLQSLASTQNLDQQRTHFEPISAEMYELVQDYRFNDDPVYRQYCPMAFNDRGAYWLSDEEPIRNPYFGHEMLRCGEVREVVE